jgi:CubicO group peptidase (beta-lactamase class C family)
MLVKTRLAAFMATVLLGGGAQAAAQNKGAAVGCAQARWSRAFIADDPVAESLNRLLTRYTDYGFSGAMLLVNNGQPLINQGYGWADAEAGIASSHNTLYDVASITKTFTAAAILDLESRGKLKTSDKLSLFIRELPAEKEGITLHHLLTHTAGFPLHTADIDVNAADRTDDIIGKAAAAKLIHAPGSQYRYSNVGYALLAHVIESVSGRPWHAYVKTRLINRAKLQNTYLYGDPLPKGRFLAQGYQGPSEEDAKPQPPLRNNANSPLIWGKHPLGATGVLSSVTDLQRWWCALNGTMLPQEQRRKMFTIQAENQGYGWNIRQENSVTTRISRGGSRQPFISQLTYYPQRSALLAFGTNKYVEGMWHELVLRNVDRALNGEPLPMPPAIIKLAEAAVQKHAGTYFLEGGGKLIIRVSSGVLYVGAEGARAVEPLVYSAGEAPSYLRRLETLSEQVASALSRTDRRGVEQLGQLAPVELARLEVDWSRWMKTTGGLKSVEVLGSTPGFDGNTRVFIRLQGATGQQVIRLLWSAKTNAIVAWGDDIALPAYSRLWPQSGIDFVTYDFDNGRANKFRFSEEGGIEVVPFQSALVLRGSR